jgi:hypothetical protein
LNEILLKSHVSNNEGFVRNGEQEALFREDGAVVGYNERGYGNEARQDNNYPAGEYRLETYGTRRLCVR